MSTFRAYLIIPPAGSREWDTVMDRAKARARELGGESHAYEVPATKATLIPFLNDLEKRLSAPPAAAEPLPAPTVAPAPPAPPRPLKTAPAVRDVDTFVEWLLDGATQAEIETIFGALGARFGEAIRPARRAA